MQRNKLGNIKI